MAVKVITFNSFTMILMSLFLIPFAAIAAIVVYPLASHAHGKGIYQSKADAQQRASEIGCKRHQNNGSGCHARMSVNFIANFASNEPTKNFMPSKKGSPLACSPSGSPVADHRRHWISLQRALGARD